MGRPDLGRSLAALLVAATLVAVVAAPVASGGEPLECPPRDAKRVLASSPRAALVLIDRRSLRGCARPRGEAHRLGNFGPTSPSISADFSTPAAAGRYVAFGTDYYDDGATAYRVNVFDVIRGRFIRQAPTGRFDPARPPPNVPSTGADVGIGPTVDLALRRDGAVAWIAREAFGSTFEVHVIDGDGRRLLARSETIGERSLRLGPTRVSWVEDGHRRRADVGPVDR